MANQKNQQNSEPKSVLNGGKCLCGCGTETKRKSLFASGHDARTAGYLQRMIRGRVKEDDADLRTIIDAYNAHPLTEQRLKVSSTPQDVANAISPAMGAKVAYVVAQDREEEVEDAA